jgi:hypothetical protein
MANSRWAAAAAAAAAVMVTYAAAGCGGDLRAATSRTGLTELPAQTATEMDCTC